MRSVFGTAMMRFPLWLGWLALVAIAGCGRSDEPPAKPAAKVEGTFEERWDKADADRDGKLSRAEAGKGLTPGVSKNFDRIDANKDGFVTREERAAFRAGLATK